MAGNGGKALQPDRPADQQLISTFPGYNFDMFTDADMQYEIDVTQPVGSRIKNLTYKGAAVTAAMNFIVATNNYRASGGGNFPGLDGTKTVYASPDANRDVLISYVKTLGAVTRTANGNARSWHFTKVVTSGDVVFSSGVGMLAQAAAGGVPGVTLVAADDGSGKNLSKYKIDLNQ